MECFSECSWRHGIVEELAACGFVELYVLAVCLFFMVELRVLSAPVIILLFVFDEFFDIVGFECFVGKFFGVSCVSAFF